MDDQIRECLRLGRLVVAAGRVGQAIQLTDERGYCHEIFAATMDVSGKVAYVEVTSKTIGEFVDIKYVLHLLGPDGEAFAWEVETYNPYFGCEVSYLEWHGEVVVIIYDEKHHTYAACVGFGGLVKRERLSSAGFSNWVMGGGRIGFWGFGETRVGVMTVPGLVRGGEVTEVEARAMGVLPGRG